MNETIGIALVDDNDIDLMIGERLISVINPDIAVKTFNSGKAVLEWLSVKEHACIAEKVIFFIDIYMPDMNGFDVAERAFELIKAKGCKAECYLLSATIDDTDLQRIKAHSRIAGFIGKPITASIIDELVKSLKHV